MTKRKHSNQLVTTGGGAAPGKVVGGGADISLRPGRREECGHSEDRDRAVGQKVQHVSRPRGRKQLGSVTRQGQRRSVTEVQSGKDGAEGGGSGQG